MTGAKVLLLDGPLSGQIVTYGHPLPPTLVVADTSNGRPRWHDYRQTVVAHHYRHSDRCPCTYKPQRPIDLDEGR